MNILGTLGHRTEWREGMFEVIPAHLEHKSKLISMSDLFPALCTVAALQGACIIRGRCNFD